MTAINLTIKKHWLVYIRPVAVLLLALFVIYMSFGFTTEWIFITLLSFGIIIALSQIMSVLYLASVRWTFNGSELVVSNGVLPWKKSRIQIPIFDIYDSSVTNAFWGHYLHFGHIAIRRTEGVTSHISERFLRNAVEFSATVNQYVQDYKKKQNANPNTGKDITLELERLSYLKSIGSLTEEEYETLKKRLIEG